MRSAKKNPWSEPSQGKGRFETRGQKTEGRGQTTEVGEQKTEVREQKTEVRGQKTEAHECGIGNAEGGIN
jgi:hypothetical protein